jgi:long-chain acyl-CoA synthetase
MAYHFENLVEVYERSVTQFADHRLFGEKKDGEYRWITYGEFGERVEACRAALAARGVGVGDTVAIISDNRVEWAVCAYATYGLGARYCPMYESQSIEDRTYILQDSEASFLFTANEDIRRELEQIQSRGDLANIENMVHFDGPGDNFEAFLDEGAGRDVVLAAPDPDDVCGLIYTSGTTGKPKGVLLTHRNITSNVNAIHDIDIIEPDDISLAFLPWAHSFGQTVELQSMFSLGASMALVENMTTIVKNLGEVRPTILCSVPRVFNKIYDGVHRKMSHESGIKQKLFSWSMTNANKLREARERGKSPLIRLMLDWIFDKLIFSKVRERFGGRLRYAVSGGAKLNHDVAIFLDNLHITVLEGYGLTETSPIVSVNLPNARRIGSVGKPIPGVDVELRPVEGHAHNGEGEICIRGPNVMKGYFHLPDKTADVLDDDGTFHTGDLGRIDKDGFLFVSGRVKEQFKLENGKYVAPGPMEEELKLSPFIDQVLVDGANRPFNMAIINIDREGMDEWARENNLLIDDYVEDERVRKLLEGEIERRTARFKKYERPQDFVLVDDEWTTENGVLTPKLSMKRRVIMKKYADEIEAIYNGEARKHRAEMAAIHAQKEAALNPRLRS